MSWYSYFFSKLLFQVYHRDWSQNLVLAREAVCLANLEGIKSDLDALSPGPSKLFPKTLCSSSSCLALSSFRVWWIDKGRIIHLPPDGEGRGFLLVEVWEAVLKPLLVCIERWEDFYRAGFVEVAAVTFGCPTSDGDGQAPISTNRFRRLIYLLTKNKDCDCFLPTT